MAIQLLPLIAGAALGALATYLYKDDEARKSIKKGVDKVGDKLAEGANSIKETVSRKTKSTKAEKEPKAAPKATKKKVAKKKVSKKRPTKKKTASKKTASKKAANKKTSEAA